MIETLLGLSGYERQILELLREIQDSQTTSDGIIAPWLPYNHSTDASKCIKNSTGFIHSFYLDNTSQAMTYYLQLFDKASPADSSDVPIITPFELPPSTAFALGAELFGARGIQFGAGICYGISTTRDTYTAGTASDIKMTIWFE